MKRIAIALSLVMAAGAPLTGCSTNPSTGRDQLLLVSSDEVSQMGLQATPDLIKEYGGELKNPQVQQYVSQVGQKLARQVEPEYKDINWKFHVLDSDVINAFSLPPGEVFISRGLLEKLSNEAELAEVLGHEMGHVTAKHVSERISQQMLVQGVAEGVSSAVSGSQGATSQLIPLVVGLGGQGYLLKFSRDQESEADRQGLKYMTKAGYDPQGAAGVMKVLINADKGNSQWEILSTHPDPQRRLEDIQKLIKSQYAFTQNNPKYQLYPQKFQQQALTPLRG